MSVQCHCGSWNHEPRHHPPDDHLVWAEGPPCDENCPGETSQWHDGYAWGTERAEIRLRRIEEAARALLPLAEGMEQDLQSEFGQEDSENLAAIAALRAALEEKE